MILLFIQAIGTAHTTYLYRDTCIQALAMMSWSDLRRLEKVLEVFSFLDCDYFPILSKTPTSQLLLQLGADEQSCRPCISAFKPQEYCVRFSRVTRTIAVYFPLNQFNASLSRRTIVSTLHISLQTPRMLCTVLSSHQDDCCVLSFKSAQCLFSTNRSVRIVSPEPKTRVHSQHEHHSSNVETLLKAKLDRLNSDPRDKMYASL